MLDTSVIKKGIQTAVRYTNAHSNTILTGLGAVGFVATVVEACKRTPKYEEIIARHEADGEKIDIRTKLEAGAKAYWPVGLMGVGSLACFISANRISAKRIATLAAGYSIAEKNLKEYQDKAKELFGKKEEKINEAIIEDKISAIDTNTTRIQDTGHGTTLVMDCVTKKIYRTDISRIERIVNQLNETLIRDAKTNAFDDDAQITWNDFASALNFEESSIGDNIGWNFRKDGIIKVDMSNARSTMDGVPCIYLDYQVYPLGDWGDEYKGWY